MTRTERSPGPDADPDDESGRGGRGSPSDSRPLEFSDAEDDYADRVDEALAALWRGEPAAFPDEGDDASGHLEEALREIGRRATPIEPSLDLKEGDRIGAYVVQERLGVGGMGVVHAAIHVATGRRVAIKVMRPGANDEQTLRWFRREMQALSRIQHPGIATLYEVGTHGERQPYLVMELVDGCRLDVFGAAESSERDDGSGRGRRRTPPILAARLVAATAEAVEAAHRRGVVHLDLKPSNIRVDRSGQPKVLDFGLARVHATEGEQGMDVTQSLHRPLVGTIQYMAPEQVRGDRDALDTRTDVWALGVVLYELLTGRRPFDVHPARMYDAVRILVEQTPRPPSQVVAGLDRDLDVIVGKALAKDPERRYGSAQDLADDLRRWLKCEPIEARPPTIWYRVDRFVRRRRRLSAGLAVVAVALATALVLTVRATANALRAEAVAKRQTRAARESLTILTDLFSQASPGRAGHDVTLVEFLEDKAEHVDALDRSRQIEPAVIAALHAAIGRALQTLDRFERALPHLERALQLRRALRDPIEIATSLRDLGFCLHAAERLPEALPLLEEALAVRSGILPPTHEDVHQSREELASLLSVLGRKDEADRLHGEGLAIARASDDAALLVRELMEYGEFLINSGRVTTARALLREATAIARATGEPARRRIQILRHLAHATAKDGDEDEGRRLLEGAFLLAEAELEPTDLERANLHSMLAHATYNAGDKNAGIEHARRVVEIRLARQGAAAQETLLARSLLVTLLEGRDGPDATREAREEFVADCERFLGSEHSISVKAAAYLASVHRGVGDHQGAQQVIEPYVPLIDRDDLPLEARMKIADEVSRNPCFPPETRVQRAEQCVEFSRRLFQPEHGSIRRALLRTVDLALECGVDEVAFRCICEADDECETDESIRALRLLCAALVGDLPFDHEDVVASRGRVDPDHIIHRRLATLADAGDGR
jgi:serine/threonine protein kinase/tetratricopeptide (TPR) repeat protein